MRGQAPFWIPWALVLGITPADAGTSDDHRVIVCDPEDHPRGCGDKRRCKWQRREGRGSPPRMRGQGIWSTIRPPSGRITPADAGTSSREVNDWAHGEDHPRGCGDKPGIMMAKPSLCGSPPRMRGQEPLHLRHSGLLRITPADAGTRFQDLVDLSGLRDHPRGCGDK